MTDFAEVAVRSRTRHTADASLKPAEGRAYALVAWLCLIPALLPTRELSLQVGVNLTPGRICVILLLAPALMTLTRGGARFRWPDAFALATAGWIVIASVSVKGPAALLTAAGGEALEYLGAYLIGRAFFAGTPTLRELLHVLRIVTVVLLLFALADRVTGQWIIENTAASLMHVTPAGANYRLGVIRATASLDHPILLGAFFAVVSTLFCFSNESPMRRIPYILAGLVGCYLTLSSASVMAWGIGVAAFFYDRLLRTFPWRWGLFWAALASLMAAVMVVANAPLGWVLTHLTWDPQSAYFRYLIWNHAIDWIAQSPFVGFDFSKLNDSILDASVDCVWLVYALRFGVPMIVFLFLTNLTAVWPLKQGAKPDADGDFLIRMSRGCTVMLLLFMFIGLTVHFWNFMWIFWGLMQGVKATIRDRAGRQQRGVTKTAPTMAVAFGRHAEALPR
ncbi:MAG TPA: hypothetical protein VN715_19115 [Roseiarcus sp.]|nr:hypothetical protein [Roseiarcus sp.]